MVLKIEHSLDTWHEEPCPRASLENMLGYRNFQLALEIQFRKHAKKSTFINLCNPITSTGLKTSAALQEKFILPEIQIAI